MSLVEKIKTHEQEILSGQTPENLKHCPKCQGTPQSFKSHGLRDRIFLVIIGAFVHQIQSFLGRWKCPLCHCSFTYYPDFALPFKRYLKDSILPLARTYVEEDTSTYRKVVQDNDSAIGYASSEHKEGIDERQLHGSTIWRWLSFIGSLKQTLCQGLNIIRQKSPSSCVFREILPVHSHKYKSEKRKVLLGFSQRFFVAETAFSQLFGSSIFPRFATGYL